MHILKPIVHDTVWGGSNLTQLSGCTSTNIGHLYSVVDNAHFSNTIATGPYKGKLLSYYFAQKKEELGLTNYPQFPLIIALVDASQNLSVQVHPDDVAAQKLEGHPVGKNESFYILRAPQSGKMINGCKCSSLEKLKNKTVLGEIMDVVDYLPLQAGDYVYIKAGTLHAATEGSISFEIEENCDLTYRFFDYNRKGADGSPRPLQIEKALSAVDITKKSRVRRYNGEAIREKNYTSQFFEKLDKHVNGSQTIEIITLIEGKIEIEGFLALPGTAMLLEPGEEIIFPSPVKAMLVRPNI